MGQVSRTVKKWSGYSTLESALLALVNSLGELTASLSSLDRLSADLSAHENDVSNPHQVTAAQVGLTDYVEGATDATLSETGAGPFTLGLNLGNSNTWTAGQEINPSGTGTPLELTPHAVWNSAAPALTFNNASGTAQFGITPNSGGFMVVTNAGGTDTTNLIANGYLVGTASDGKVDINYHNAGIGLRSVDQFTWSDSASQVNSSRDLGLAREAAGQLRISNGGSGKGSLVVGGVFPDYMADNSGSAAWYLNSGSLDMGSGQDLLWSSTAAYSGTKDAGICRLSAGFIGLSHDGGTSFSHLNAQGWKVGGAGLYASLNYNGADLRVAANFLIAWSDTAYNASTLDTGLARVSAAVVEVNAGTAGSAASAQSVKWKVTAEGGYAIKVVAGEALVAGNVVYVKQTSGADGKVWKAPTTGDGRDMPIGVAYAAADADADVWVVVSGIVSVLPESGITATRGYVMYCSGSEAGTVNQSSSAPVSDHWRECGHFLDTGAGNGTATRAIIHFN